MSGISNYRTRYIDALTELRDLTWTAADQCYTLAEDNGSEALRMMANEWDERHTEYVALLAPELAAARQSAAVEREPEAKGKQRMTTPKTYIIEIDTDGSSRVTLRRSSQPDAYADLSAYHTEIIIKTINSGTSAHTPDAETEPEPERRNEPQPPDFYPMWHAANVVWSQVDLALDELHGIELRLEDAKDLLVRHIVNPLAPDEEEE